MTYSQLPTGVPLEGSMLTKRFMAYLIDLVMITILWIVLALAIMLLGIITFGLGWQLFFFLPLTGILYSTVTISGPAQATFGMRTLSLHAVNLVGDGKIPWYTAAAHAVLFYVATGTFILLVIDLVIGLFRRDKRLGHDILTGLQIVG